MKRKTLDITTHVAKRTRNVKPKGKGRTLKRKTLDITTHVATDEKRAGGSKEDVETETLDITTHAAKRTRKVRRKNVEHCGREAKEKILQPMLQRQRADNKVKSMNARIMQIVE